MGSTLMKSTVAASPVGNRWAGLIYDLAKPYNVFSDPCRHTNSASRYRNHCSQFIPRTAISRTSPGALLLPDHLPLLVSRLLPLKLAHDLLGLAVTLLPLDPQLF